MKVKIFVSMRVEQMEEEINNFILENKVDIVDIKFSVAEKFVSALIIYKS